MIDQICFNDMFLDSAKEVFETMIFMDMAETDEPDMHIDGEAILGSITFKGELEGCLSIACSMACARTITMNMLGVDSVDQVTEGDVCDAIGEVSNMIMGGAKKRLHGTFSAIELSIPSVVNGRELHNNIGDHVQKVSAKVKIEEEHIAELSLVYREKSK